MKNIFLVLLLEFRGVMLMCMMPFIIYLPVFMEVNYQQIKELWMLIGVNLHAAIAISAIYLYRKDTHIISIILMAAAWFTIMAVLVVFTHSAEWHYKNYIITAIIYILTCLLINFITQWKIRQRKG